MLIDGPRFDAISRMLAERRAHRRSFLRAAGAGAAGMVGAAGLHAVAAQQGTPMPEGTPAAVANPRNFLFVQSFAKGALAPIAPGAATPLAPVALPGATPVAIAPPDYVLTLGQGLGQTIFFSDRPERIVGAVPTKTFLDRLGFSPTNPPNAALVADLGDGNEDILIVELTNPRYDTATSTATYDIRLLDDDERVHMQLTMNPHPNGHPAETYGASHLFIDDCPDAAFWCTTPDAWIGCFSKGVITEGTCWDWISLNCDPCRDYSDICNQLWPDFCQGNCIVKTSHDVMCDCEGHC